MVNMYSASLSGSKHIRSNLEEFVYRNAPKIAHVYPLEYILLFVGSIPHPQHPRHLLKHIFKYLKPEHLHELLDSGGEVPMAFVRRPSKLVASYVRSLLQSSPYDFHQPYEMSPHHSFEDLHGPPIYSVPGYGFLGSPSSWGSPDTDSGWSETDSEMAWVPQLSLPH